MKWPIGQLERAMYRGLTPKSACILIIRGTNAGTCKVGVNSQDFPTPFPRRRKILTINCEMLSWVEQFSD